MKKIFITGGSGTVGKSFIESYYNQFKFYSFSRNEKEQISLKRRFPEIEIIIGGVENKFLLTNEVSKIRPDIIIHAAALKHIDTAEKQPSQAVLSNIIGSYNIINASINSNVKITIGISTDKACSPDSVYGQSKYIMERLFLEHDNSNNKFICCRFGNVAGSNGSVIPFWLTKLNEKKSLPLTDKRMTRLMFSHYESSELIMNCIKFSQNKGGFILSKKMKTVNMYKLAKLISKDIKFIGLRPGEKLYENLISESELKYTEVKDDFIFIHKDINQDHNTKLDEKLSSDNAIEMSKQEMLFLIDDVKKMINFKLIDEKKY